jgi:hypothetical protein
MKKLVTLVLGSILALTVSAQRQAVVVINSHADLEVRIDGNTYTKPSTNNSNMLIPNLAPGNHNLEIYRLSRGFLGIGKKREILSRTTFYLGNNNVTINVDHNGIARISQRGVGRNNDIAKGNRGRDDNDWNNRNKKPKNNNGKKKGHYKNGKYYEQ